MSEIPSPEVYEKLGAFYLGKLRDSPAAPTSEHLLLYDSKDLTTHAVCVGMTGSGKTGLCLALLEEAAIDGIPALIIDPKGDLGNLLLTFPNLSAEEFRPWIHEEEARRKNLEPDAFAQQQATLWRDGLARWGQSAERIQRLRSSAEFAIYTPGSHAGRPLSVLRSFAPPVGEAGREPELWRERIQTTVSSLLGLLRIHADPMQSREHILLSNLLDHAWKAGTTPDLPALMALLQKPPFEKVGVLDLETFFPSKDRFNLVMALNNLLASPGFSAWMEGEALDLNNLLHTPEGKPRHAIISIAHLSDSERMFVVSMLLNEAVSWMRTQSGTSSLRAIIYMDEIFGYFPPVANPPSKPPLLTLLKQARAFGVGTVLATQNPVDLDYKGLSNTGTWFIGRLQTERDKARVMEGLEGAAASSGKTFNRAALEQTLAGLGNRVFLMNNVHEDAPILFETRWCLSYLRGPLTRDQIKKLTPPPAAAHATTPPPPPSAGPLPHTPSHAAPTLPPEVPVCYPSGLGAGQSLEPSLIAICQITFSDARRNIHHIENTTFLVPIRNTPVPIDWNDLAPSIWQPEQLVHSAPEGAVHGELPALAHRSQSYDLWKKEFMTWLLAHHTLDLWKSPSTGLLSEPGEDERHFRLRVLQTGREIRDAQVAALRKKFATRLNTLQDRLARSRLRVDSEKGQARQAQLQTALSVGSTVLGALFGRKALSATSMTRATTAARGMSRSMKEAKDVALAEESVASLEAQLAELQQQMEMEVRQVESGAEALSETLEPIQLRPKRTGIAVRLFSLFWSPQPSAR
jgi:hypothetical protein